MKNDFLISVSIVVVVVQLVGCIGARNARPAAEAAVAEFHQRFNDGRFEEIYQAADPRFRESTSVQEMNKLFTALDRKLGKVTSTSNQSWNVKTFNITTTIVMVQKTEFEQSSGIETFSFEIHSEKAVVLNYHITSNGLITK